MERKTSSKQAKKETARCKSTLSVNRTEDKESRTVGRLNLEMSNEIGDFCIQDKGDKLPWFASVHALDPRQLFTSPPICQVGRVSLTQMGL